ncbi:YdcF family protein [Pontibacter diazotrophicus]|uniref:YdcF family protein n=1 Tax=Pontibacter diazotrophicus TaxID=1400979 RepID=A0A3D8L8L4_9BACT|nr:YdcF family protein [Pontibacter diazotrophicus]RDV13745.1 YdcF family protein [Pontibacter diazotrophicus]
MQTTQHYVSLFNTLIPFLAKRDIHSLTEAVLEKEYNITQADLLILLGNSSLYVAVQAASAYHRGLAKELMICGGIGHSTRFLEENIEQHPGYNDVLTGGRAEADMLKDIFVKHWDIQESSIIVENQSTNCGSNALEAYQVLEQLQKQPQTILLLQDPVLQRRSQASFEKVWQQQDNVAVQFISFAAFVPLLKLKEGKLTYTNEAHSELCGIDRLLSLVMGEIPRLRNNENGYGPRGKGFITAVEIPAEVEAAYEELAALYPEYVRV